MVEYPTAWWVACAFRAVRDNELMECRAQCGACCIAPSISSSIPGMPQGKPAGVRCVQLLPDFRCALFGQPERPAVCVSLRPGPAMCGTNRDAAMEYLTALERATG
jgi:Fe-S-cluster containining protein